MNNSTNSAIKFSLGILCFQGFSVALAQDAKSPAIYEESPSDYWFPAADPAFADLADVEPVEFEEQSTGFPLSEDEGLAEEPLYQNLRAMSAANSWAGDTSGAAGFAPVGPPSGFNTVPAAFPTTSRGGDSLLRDISLAVNLSGTYDSNVNQSSGVGGRTKRDDFITSLGGTLSYMSKARVWTFGGSYTGAYNIYANNSQFDGYTQSGSLIANYDGGKLSTNITAGLSTGRGGNRFLGASDFVEQTQINVSIAARYVYSAKTVLTSTLSHGFTTTEGPFSDTNGTSLGFAALYRYSPLTEIGPGIRFTRQNGGGGNDRTSVGPTLNLNYRYSTKLSLVSQLGLNFADFSQVGSSDVTVSSSIGLNYQASPLWGMNLTLFRDSQPDPSVSGSFRETTALRLGYTRQIRRASLGLGFSYENSAAFNDGIGGTRPDRDYFSVDASLGMRIFADTTNASVFVRYSDQISNSVESFDSFQVGFSLSRGF